MTGAVIYARYSCERQTEQSIEGQLRECNKYAEQNGLTIIDTYIDRATTGTNDNRSAFQQMLADAEKPVLWDIVLVYAIDRFGRNSIEIALNKQKLKKNNKRLISATQRTSENLDGTKNLDGILLENMYIGLAEYYSAELSQKIRRGLHESRLKGLYCGGTPPYGYKVIDKKIYINEEQAQVVRYIFQEYLNGKYVREIIEDLTEKGILYKGVPFVYQSVCHILHLEKYTGIARYTDGVFDNLYPQIVDKNVFDAVQTLLERNKIGSHSKTVDLLLKGKLVCGYCGYNLQGDSSLSKEGKTHYYYKCAGRKKHKICNKKVLNKDKIEKFVIDVTSKIFANEENLSIIADKVFELHNKRMKDRSVLNLLKQQLSETETALKNIMKAVEQGIITKTTKSRIEELEKQQQMLNDKIIIEQHKENAKLKKDDIKQYLRHAIKKEPRLMLYHLIQKIVAYDDKLEIYYNYIDNRNNPVDPNQDQRDFTFVDKELSVNLCLTRKIELTAFVSQKCLHFTVPYEK